MYLQNKYTRWYYNIISHAKARILSSDIYVEKHHIIPKSLGGNNSKENIALLTAREHFICHLLLIKMTTGNACIKMKFALSMITGCKNIGEGRYITPYNRIYEIVKKNHRDAIQEYWTEERKQERALVTSNRKKNIKLSETHKANLRKKVWSVKAIQTRLDNCLKAAEARKGSNWTKEMRNAMFNSFINKNIKIAIELIELYDSGLSYNQLSKKYAISWERVKNIVNHRKHFIAF